MKKSLLFISFQYPPEQASSGLLRSLSFSRDLANLGWDVSVLTASQDILNTGAADNLNLIPENIKIVRKRAYDAAKSFSVNGRYPGFLEWPDRYSSWIIFATIAGLRAIKRDNLNFVFSTYPIASAHLIGYFLAKLARLPWIADFRDPMVMATHPDTPLRRKAHEWVENKAINYCSLALFTTKAAKDAYIEKYPNVPCEKFHVIENGFDEEIFTLASALPRQREQRAGRKLRILHSGTLYPDHRDPEPLFIAINKRRHEWHKARLNVEFVFRASGYDEYYSAMIEKYDLKGLVTFLSPISYIESIREILESDGLLLIQGASCNNQIPAKLYEYLRGQKPIFAMADPNGATATLLADHGRVTLANGNDIGEIEDRLTSFFERTLAKSDSDNNEQMLAESRVFARSERSKELDLILRKKFFDVE